ARAAEHRARTPFSSVAFSPAWKKGDAAFGGLPRSQRYFSRIGFRSSLVWIGQSFRSVIIAVASARWHGQLGSAGICGRARAIMALATAAFLVRFAMTISTVTCASSAFQQS